MFLGTDRIGWSVDEVHLSYSGSRYSAQSSKYRRQALLTIDDNTSTWTSYECRETPGSRETLRVTRVWQQNRCLEPLSCVSKRGRAHYSSCIQHSLEQMLAPYPSCEMRAKARHHDHHEFQVERAALRYARLRPIFERTPVRWRQHGGHPHSRGGSRRCNNQLLRVFRWPRAHRGLSPSPVQGHVAFRCMLVD